MKIAFFDIFLLEVPLGGEIYNPRVLWHRKQSILIRLTDSDGNVGWGECWCFDTSADSLVRFLQTEIRPLVVDCSIEAISDFWTKIWAMTSLSGRHGMVATALSALDIALYDICSQKLGTQLGAMCASTPLRDSVPVYASGGLYRINDSLERLSTEVKGMVAEGHNRIKIKFGAYPFEKDVERLKTVRESIGPNVGLIVDAVYSLDVTKAKAWLPVWEEIGVEAVQAPFPIQDWSSMSWLNNDCGVRVMVFETESRFEIFKALLKEKAIGVLQFSPIAAGGITASKKIIELAKEFDVPVSLQCSSTWVAQSAAFELARGNSQVEHVELHTLHKGLFEYVCQKESVPSNGMLKLHQRNGLGFAPPVNVLNKLNEHLHDYANTNVMTNQSAPICADL
jgi:L-alanine-DL-glutamate epimerase-like enolase superfamily enzyme